MFRPVALAFAVLAFSAGATAAAPPSPTQIFRDHCVPFLQGARTTIEAQALAKKAGFEPIDAMRFRTPAGQLDFSTVIDGRRFCRVWLPLGADYGAVLAAAGAMVKVLPDGPYTQSGEPGPDEDQQRGVGWGGPRYNVEVTEDINDDYERHLVLSGGSRKPIRP